MKKTLIFSMAVVMLCLSVNAATVAYWRFEDGTNGVVNGTYLDTSGNGSTMTVNGGTGTSDVPWPTVPKTSQANLLAATYENGSNAFTGDYLTTDGSEYIDTLNFVNGWTIEAIVKFNGNTNWDVHARPGIVCKEGNNVTYPFFNLQLDENDKIRVVTSRTSPSERRLYGSTTLEMGKWYALAVTYNPLESGSERTVKLYLKGELDASYNYEGSCGGPWSGIILDGDTPWTIGRGMRDNGPKGYVDGTIDEVRISDEVLAESDFLAIPEPSLIFGGIALALLAFRRK